MAIIKRDTSLFNQLIANVINLRKLEGAHSDIFYHEEHEGREDKEKFFVFFVVINNKIA